MARMLKGLISRVLGRSESASSDRQSSRLIEHIPETETQPATPAPEPHVASADMDVPRRPGILSAYAPATSGDNPLAIREVRKTGGVTWTAEREGWCINPSTSFPLTVIGTDEKTARQVREAMYGLVDHHAEDVSEAVAGLMVERGARFREFEAYLCGQRRVFQSTLAAVRSKKTDCIEGDDEIELEALESLDGCCDDFGGLIHGDYPSDATELAVIRKFGYGNLRRYLATGPATVNTVPVDHRKRRGFDALIKAGLAIPGSEIAAIPTEALLHAFTLKEMQALSVGMIPSKSRKKHLAVEFLLAQSGIRERAIAAIDLDSVVYFVPANGVLTGLDVGPLHERMAFAFSVANRVVATYLTPALAPTNREYEGKHLAREPFRLHNVRDVLTCRTCLEAHGESKPLAEWTRFPLHFGCRCSLLIGADRNVGC